MKHELLNENNIDSNANTESLNIYPAKLLRRILSFLGDFFITFILVLFLYEVVCMPVTKVIINYDNISDNLLSKQKKRIDYLYDKNVLFSNDLDTDFNKYNYEEALSYTTDQFVFYYTFKDDSSFDLDISEYNVIYNYYNDSNKTMEEISKIIKGNDPNSMFEDALDSNNELILKQEYQKEFIAYFNENDSLSSQGENNLNTFKNNYFNANYADIVKNISTNDLNYISIVNEIDDINNYLEILYQVNVLVSFIFGTLIVYLIFPLCNKKSKTPTKMILKLEYIDTRNFERIKKSKLIYLYFLNIIECLMMVVFIPMISLGFVKIFSLSILLVLSVISLIYCLIDLLIAFGNGYNKSIKELFFNTIVINEETSNQILLFKERKNQR